MTTTSNIAPWVTDRAATDPGLPAIKQGDTVLSYGDLDAAAPGSRPCWPTTAYGRRPGGDDDAERRLLPGRLLRDPAPRRDRGADEPAAQGRRDRLHLDRLRREVAVVFPLFAEEATKAATPAATGARRTASSSEGASMCSARMKRSRPIGNISVNLHNPARQMGLSIC